MSDAATQGQSARPKEVGGYEILGKLGQGGMGAVFKARQKSLDRIVALKILPPSIAKDSKFIERFQREARASAKLNHPNIVQGIDVGKDPATGLWFFAMEYVDGPSLHHVLKEQNVIPEERALTITRDICHALECAQAHGIVHRDIKPDNILLTQRGEAKLADLGLAKQLSDDASVTQSGQSVGTPNYMAPEQARGETANIDIRTDIYALGGTLFHLVTGRTPFDGPTSVVIMTKHLTEPPPKANKFNPEVSEACSRLITKMMQKKREQRVQSPKELIEQIEKILNAEEAETVPKTGPRKQIRKDTTGPRVPVASQDSTMKWVALGAAALVIIGAIGYGLMGQKPPAQPQPTPGPVAVAPKDPAPVIPAPATPTKPNPNPNEIKPPSEPVPVPPPVQPSPAQPAPAKPPVDWAAVKEFAGRRTLAQLEKNEKDGKMSAAELRIAYEQFVKQFAGSKVGELAAEKLKALQSGSEKSATPDNSSTKEPAASQADLAAKEAEAHAAKTQELFASVLKETAPLMAANKFNDALALLEQKAGSSALADARDLIKQEKADIEAIQDVRRQAVAALRKTTTPVTVKKGSGTFTGTVSEDAKADSFTLKIGNGAALSLSADQLHFQDVDQYAPKPSTPEDFRRRGLLFLAAGDKDSAARAKEFFTKAHDAGAGDAMNPYFDRVLAIEMGEIEAAAQKYWLKCESLFTEKKYKDAEEAYGNFQTKYAKTKTLAKNSDLLAQRLKAIEKFNKPEITFRAKESMKMYPPGHRQNQFPAQEGDDPLAPFDFKPAYFQQQTGSSVIYDVRSPRPVKGLRWKGAAMQNMTIEILDAKGNNVTTGGPYEGGNNWAEFNVSFDPQKDFTIKLKNHISTWYFIKELELKF